MTGHVDHIVNAAQNTVVTVGSLHCRVAGVVKHVWRTYGDKDGDKEVVVTVRKLKSGETPKGLALDADGKPRVTSFTFHRDEPMTEEQRKKFERASKEWAEQSKQWAQFGEQFGEQWAKDWQKRAQEWQKAAQEWQKKWQKDWPQGGPQSFTLNFEAPAADVECRDGKSAKAKAAAKALRPAGNENLMRQVVICDRIARASARNALVEARARVAHARDLSVQDREEVLDSLDREIDRLDRDVDPDNDNNNDNDDN